MALSPNDARLSGKTLQRVFKRVVNLKKIDELGDDKDFVNLRVDARETKLAIFRANPVVHCDQRAKRCG